MFLSNSCVAGSDKLFDLPGGFVLKKSQIKRNPHRWKNTNIKVNRIKVVTENSVVFLLGVVSKKQANIASQIARKTPGVQKVVRLWELL